MGNSITTRPSSQKRTSLPIDLGLCSIFNYEELQEATQFFNPSEVVGEGGYGVVYRGKLRDGRAVAIKELKDPTAHHNKQQFFNEVRILSQLRHKNLVTLYGCTNPDDKKIFLIYEFVPNGTVADNLHHRRFFKKTLTWSQRLQIAIQTAEGLDYLHSLQQPIIHRDVKTNNILLDNNFDVKVADFGLCRLLPPSGSHITTMPQGTQGYLDPEYNQLYKLTTKSDVYSFGVVLMELISRKPVLDFERADDEIWLVNMAFNEMKNDNLNHLVDPELGYLKDTKISNMVNSVVQLAYKCLQPKAFMRPLMTSVLKSLKEIRDDDGNTRPLKSLKETTDEKEIRDDDGNTRPLKSLEETTDEKEVSDDSRPLNSINEISDDDLYRRYRRDDDLYRRYRRDDDRYGRDVFGYPSGRDDYVYDGYGRYRRDANEYLWGRDNNAYAGYGGPAYEYRRDDNAYRRRYGRDDDVYDDYRRR